MNLRCALFIAALSSVISVVYCSYLTADNQPENQYKVVQLSSQTSGQDLFYHFKDNLYFVFTDKPSGESINKFDYGKRLLLIRKEANGSKILFRSLGSADSYILRPTFFKNNRDDSLIILAEIGTEYSWGARVFVIRNEWVQDVGTLEVAVQDNKAPSVIPHVIIQRSGEDITFEFKKDLLHNPGGTTETDISKNKIKYIYKNDKLTEIIIN
jgi:hypothetical protein